MAENAPEQNTECPKTDTNDLVKTDDTVAGDCEDKILGPDDLLVLDETKNDDEEEFLPLDGVENGDQADEDFITYDQFDVSVGDGEKTIEPDDVEKNDDDTKDEIKMENQEPLIQEADNANHPYLHLTESFQPTTEQVSVTDIGKPKSLADTPCREVRSRNDLLKLVQDLRNEKEIAVEFQRDEKFFRDSICLLTISTKECDYLIDVAKLRNDVLLLTEIFINPKIVKIFLKGHAALSWLQLGLHLFMVNVFDTELALKYLDKGIVSFFSKLKEDYGFERIKFTNASLKVRPLPDNVKDGVRNVSHYLIYTYHEYKNELISKGESVNKEFIEKCNDLCKILFKSNERFSFDKVMADMKKRQQCELRVLEKIFAWRDALAKRINKNPENIVSKNMMIKIAATLPVTEPALSDITKSVHVLSEKVNLINIIKEAHAEYGFIDRRLRKNERKRPQRKPLPPQKKGPPPKQSPRKSAQPALSQATKKPTPSSNKRPMPSPSFRQGQKRPSQNNSSFPTSKKQRRIEYYKNRVQNQMQSNISDNLKILEMISSTISQQQLNPLAFNTNQNFPSQQSVSNSQSSFQGPPRFEPPPQGKFSSSNRYDNSLPFNRRRSLNEDSRYGSSSNGGRRSFGESSRYNSNSRGYDNSKPADMDQAVLKSALMVLKQNRNNLEMGNNYSRSGNYRSDLDQIDHRINQLQEKVGKPQTRRNQGGFRRNY